MTIQWYRLSLVLVAVLLLCGCEQAEEVRVFNWTDYIGASTIQTFEEATGTSVVYDNYSSNEELMAKMEAGGAQYDVIFPSGYAAEIMLDRGQLQRLDLSELPNRSQVMERFQSPYFDPAMEYCVPYTWSTTGIGYNRDVVAEGEIVSWGVLFDPRYRGQILMLDDMRATLGMALIYLGHSPNSRSREQVEAAGRLLVEQKPLVHVYTNANLGQLFGNEEVVLGYGWSGDIRQGKKLNAAVDYAIPREGSIIYIDYMCIPSVSDRPDLASMFINHVLQPDVSIDIARTTSYATTNQGALELAEGELVSLWADLTEGAEGVNRLEEVRNLGESLEIYDAVWKDVKAAR